MKFLFLFSFFVLVFPTFSADESESSYYENMSSIAFIYAVEVIKEVDNIEEKERICNEVLTMAFTYFSLVELGYMDRSKKLDIYIQSSCKEIYFELSNASASLDFFSDPFRWLSGSESKVIPYGELSKMNKVQYEELVSRFQQFIGLGNEKGNEKGKLRKPEGVIP